MEINYSLEELSHLTLKSPEQLTQMLTIEGEPLPTEEAKATLKSLFSEKYSKIQTDSIGRGTKQSLKGLEKTLSEKFSISTTGDVMAMVDQIIESQKGETPHTGDNDAFSLDKLTKSQAMQQPQVRDYVAKLQSENEKLQSQITEQQNSHTKQRISDKAVRRAMDVWMSKSPVLDKDETIANRQKKLFQSQIAQGNYSETEDGTFVVLDGEGMPLQKNFKDVTFEQFVLSQTPVGFAVVDQNKRIPVKYPSGKSTRIKHNFSPEDLTPKGYQAKVAELQKAGDKEGERLLYDAFCETNIGSTDPTSK
jgi:hypothetical protein